MNIDDFPFDEIVQCGQTQKELLEAIKNYLGDDTDNIWDVVDAYVALGLLDEEFSSRARNAASYVYSPYIPLLSTKTVVASSFTPSAGVMTRYGKSKINSGLYKTVNIGPRPATTTSP